MSIPILEPTLTSVIHPPHLPNLPHMILVDHPTVRVLQDGSPALGWEGDVRLAVYLDVPAQRFSLWRLEADNIYRPAAFMGEGEQITPDSMNQLILRLIGMDRNRGVDVGKEVMDHNIKNYEEQDQFIHDWVYDEIGPKLYWAFDKDGV